MGLFKKLAKKWAVPESPQDFTASRSLCSNTDSATGAVRNMGFPVLKALGDLVSRGVGGLCKIALIAIKGDGLISILHSLLLVGERAYEDGPG